MQVIVLRVSHSLLVKRRQAHPDTTQQLILQLYPLPTYHWPVEASWTRTSLTTTFQHQSSLAAVWRAVASAAVTFGPSPGAASCSSSAMTQTPRMLLVLMRQAQMVVVPQATVLVPRILMVVVPQATAPGLPWMMSQRHKLPSSVSAASMLWRRRGRSWVTGALLAWPLTACYRLWVEVPGMSSWWTLHTAPLLNQCWTQCWP